MNEVWTAAARVERAVRRLAQEGYGDVRKLVGRPGSWRLRVGDWGVVFRRDPGAIVVERVLPRRDAYREPN